MATTGFTERSQRILLIAQEEAKRLNHDYVGPEHLLLAMVALAEGIAANVLANLGVDFRTLRAEVENELGTGEHSTPAGEIPFTPRAKKVIEYAVKHANDAGAVYVGTESLLIGLMLEGHSIAVAILSDMHITLETISTEVDTALGVHVPSHTLVVPTQPEALERIAGSLESIAKSLASIERRRKYHGGSGPR